MLARCLDIESSQIRVIKPFIGGGFGARVEALNFEIVTALLARAAAGQGTMQLARGETLIPPPARPQTDQRPQTGQSRDGPITATAFDRLTLRRSGSIGRRRR